MKIAILTPQSNSPLAGNQTTAERWQAHLQALGHSVQIIYRYADEACDWLIALHAYKSAEAILRWKQQQADRPLTLMLTGTDLYQFQQQHPDVCHQSMALADTLVGLHAKVDQAIPERFHHKLHIIRQSSPWLEAKYRANDKPPAFTANAPFTAFVSGHLRQEKDSLRAACAVRDLPTTSRLQVRQAGKAHDAEWQALATAEMRDNPRYVWLGELSHDDLYHELCQARLLVMSSRMEGGANAVSECITLGLPVIASRIDGNTGLLGEDYPALFDTADTAALRALLLRAEQDPVWLQALAHWVRDLQPAFSSYAERENIRRLCEGSLPIRF